MTLNISRVQVAIALLREPTDRNCLFQLRKRAPYLGLLGLPGGKILPQEHPMIAAQREVVEETGLRPRALEPVGLVDEELRHGRAVKQVRLFVFSGVAEGLPSANPVEGDALWVTVDEVAGRPDRFIPTDWWITMRVLNGDLGTRTVRVRHVGPFGYEIESGDL